LQGLPSSNFDLLPVRETFRALRHRARQNGRLIKRASKMLSARVPFPKTADRVFAEVECAVKSFGRRASNLGRKLLRGSTPEILATAVSLQSSDDSKLAKVAYSALSSIIGHLSIKGAYVSEAAARHAFTKVGGRAELRQSETAARLLLSLLEENVVTCPETSKDGGPPRPVIVFALLLWLQSDCDDPYSGEAIFAASGLSVALSADIMDGVGRRDEKAITNLFEEFSPHV
jgi:hypothetical protein